MTQAAAPQTVPASEDGTKNNALSKRRFHFQAEKLKETWPEGKRGIPAFMLRTELAGVVKKGERKTFDQPRKLHSLQSISMLVSGVQLDGSDLDVYLELLDQVRHGKLQLGVPQEVSPYSILSGIDRETGGHEYDWLESALKRLASIKIVQLSVGAMHITEMEKKGLLEFEWNRPDRAGEKNEKKKKPEKNPISVILSPGINHLSKYGASLTWSWIDWGVRKGLRHSPLAQWLHAYYSTHQSPEPLSVEKVRAMSGSSPDQRLATFRETLRRALEELGKAAGWLGTINEKDMLVLNKTPTAAELLEYSDAAKARQAKREGYKAASAAKKAQKQPPEAQG